MKRGSDAINFLEAKGLGTKAKDVINKLDTLSKVARDDLGRSAVTPHDATLNLTCYASWLTALALWFIYMSFIRRPTLESPNSSPELAVELQDFLSIILIMVTPLAVFLADKYKGFIDKLATKLYIDREPQGSRIPNEFKNTSIGEASQLLKVYNDYFNRNDSYPRSPLAEDAERMALMFITYLDGSKKTDQLETLIKLGLDKKMFMKELENFDASSFSEKNDAGSLQWLAAKTLAKFNKTDQSEVPDHLKPIVNAAGEWINKNSKATVS